MKSLKSLKNIKNKKVLLRADLNVPIKDGVIVDDFRIKKVVETIKYLQSKGAMTIVISHLGEDGSKSLAPVALRMKKYLKKVSFCDLEIGSEKTKEAVLGVKTGEVLLLENLRKNEGEKKNDKNFAKTLASFADFFVNDAFSVCHREHASVVGIPKYLPGYAGFQLQFEVENLSKAFKAKHPFVFILGGAKFETKIPLVKKFLKLADHVFIGGAIANDFLKEKGFEVGKSLVGDNRDIVLPLLKNKKIIIPKDVLVYDGLKNINKNIDEVSKNDCILDVGQETVKDLNKILEKSKFILLNGPFGKYENGFGGSTEVVLKNISKLKSFSIVGGGDTVAIVSKLKIEKKLGFVSTGGGATLDFLAKGNLPGIRALK